MVLSSSACSSSSTASDERDAVGDLAEANAVWVADLTGNDLTVPTETALAAATFEQASDAEAARIIALLGDEGNYMTTENACFNDDAAIRLQFDDGDVLYAVIGLTCWNVSFVPTTDGQVVPDNGYLTPEALNDLALALHDVVPSLDISDVGE